MENRTSKDRSYFLVRALLKSLAHQIRTPLSVISNDLYYLQSLTPAGECDRSIEKCRGISKIFTELEWYGKASLEDQKIDLCALLQEAFLQSPKQQQSFNITADAQLLKHAFLKLRQLLLELFGQDTQMQISSEQESRVQIIISPSALPEWLPKLNYQTDNLTRLIHEYAKRDYPESCLIDAVLIASGLQVVVEVSAEQVVLSLYG